METLKKLKDCTILKKRSGRYAVLGADNKFIKGEEKVKILVKEGLVKMMKPKAKPADAPAAPAT